MNKNIQVSLTLLTFLRYEYLNYYISKSFELVSDENLFHEKQSKKLFVSVNKTHNESLVRELSMSALEESGFYLGIRIVERINDQKEIIKFICKELWSFMFLKQADRLKTNKRGGYAIFDSNLLWLTRLPSTISVGIRKMQFEPAINVIVVCGIIRGALQHLGLTCSVAAEVSKVPSCRFVMLSILINNFSGTFQIRVYAPSK
ncbi:transport protein particle (trapp) component, bet3 protein [Cryptosporidium felis]|nr:transport protein particle (trapp) component, bet3 protein [Cryptosporidium felis]